MTVRIFLVLVVILLCACDSETIVANDRTQSQAVELVALLNSHGISGSVEQRRGSQSRFNVSVPERYFNQAIALVHKFGLAGDPDPTFNDLLSNGSFLPASRAVEAFKLDLALAALVEQSLKTMSEVQNAKVVIRQNSNAARTNPSGSVVILLKPEASLSEESVRALLKAALPEVDSKDLVITISNGSYAQSSLTVQAIDNDNDTLVSLPLRDFVYWKVPEGEFKGLAWFFIALLVLAAAIFTAIGFLMAYLRYNKAVIDPQFTEPGLLGMGGTEKSSLKKINGQ